MEVNLKSKTKKRTIKIEINEQLNKPTAKISINRIKTNLNNLYVRRINETIIISLSDDEVVELRSALRNFFEY